MMKDFTNVADSFTLNNGVKIPCVGFGTWRIPDGNEAENAVKLALENGYRHIDTATVYKNETSVGNAVRQSGIPRDDIFVTTKLWNTGQGRQSVLDSFEVSRKKLALDVVDLYLVHWPNPAPMRNRFKEQIMDTWSGMEELYSSGKVRAIGVSNFLPHHLDVLLERAEVAPMVNQIRLYPGFLDIETISYCKKNNIVIQGYSPLGRGELLKSREVMSIAKTHMKSPAQVCLRWALQHDFLPLPKSVTAKYIQENTCLFDFSLTDEEMQILNNMPNYCGIGEHPDKVEY